MNTIKVQTNGSEAEPAKQILLDFIWYGICSSLIIGAFLIHSAHWAMGFQIILISTTISLSVFCDSKVLNKQGAPLLFFITLLIYSILTSNFVTRSVFIALNAMSAALFYLALLSQRTKETHAPADTQLHLLGNRAIQSIKLCLLFIVLIHAIALIAQYSDSPDRSTGFLADYSQAAFLIMLAFALVYPAIKNNYAALILVFVLFLGFFTTYSRSANFLLALFLIVLAYYEWRSKNMRWLICAALAILTAFILVNVYPLVLGQDFITRGGLQHLSTLNSRTTYWQAAWQSIQENPILGHGLGTFEWSGIKELIPFQYIPNAHNDYIQLWYELGLVWLCMIVIAQVTLMVRTFPLDITGWRSFKMTIVVSERHYIAWALLLCISFYMLINFIVGFFLFQLIICLLISEVTSSEEN